MILIRLDARQDQVVPVADLVAHTGLPREVVAKSIQELWDAGWVLPQWEWADGAQTLVGAMAMRRLPKCA